MEAGKIGKEKWRLERNEEKNKNLKKNNNKKKSWQVNSIVVVGELPLMVTLHVGGDLTRRWDPLADCWPNENVFPAFIPQRQLFEFWAIRTIM